MVGQTISHYKITEKIGEGGMGVVYKAEDTKLERTVALKFLATHLLQDSESRKRFAREAKAAAALHHPNICTIHEIDEVDGRTFIAMAFLEGESLDKKIQVAPLKIKDAIDTAIQAAEGLQAAHGKGIVHRDIKPSNLMIHESGTRRQVTIMDFGLARLADHSKLTQLDTALGTVAYMSPEQTYGAELDHRTDIWALGAVLYEMVTGQQPFQGHYEKAVIYSITSEDPEPVTALRSGVPMELERIIERALAKEPADRYQTDADLISELRKVQRTSDSRLSPAARRPSTRKSLRQEDRKKQRLAAGGLVAAALALGFLLGVLVTRDAGSLPERAELPEMSLAQLTGGSGYSTSPTWSPNGEWVAYASDHRGSMDIWKKPVAGGEEVQLTASQYNDVEPAWHPADDVIAFSSDAEGGGVFVVRAAGGTPTRLTEYGSNPTWSPDGATLAFSHRGSIYLLPYPYDEGMKPRRIVAGTSADPYPSWSSDGKRILYWDRTHRDIFLVSIEGGEPEPLGLVPAGHEASGLACSRDGHWLIFSHGAFGGNQDLWKVALDPDTSRPAGVPRRVTFAPSDAIEVDFSPDGSRLVFAATRIERQLWSLTLNPQTGLPTGFSKQIVYRSQRSYYPAFSPDGQWLVWTMQNSGQGVLYRWKLGEGEPVKVTDDWNTREVGGSFSPDSRQIAYSSTAGGSHELWLMPSPGGVPRPLTKTEHPVADGQTAWSPDPARKLIAFYSNRSGDWDIWLKDLESGEESPLVGWRGSAELYPAWSPDGRFLSFMSDKEGTGDIWRLEFPDGEPEVLVDGPYEEVYSAWSEDGRRIYFTSDRGGDFNVWMQPIPSGEAQRITNYNKKSFGLPEAAVFTKFALSPSRLVVPLESRRGDIFVLEGVM